jgi:Fe-S oxidoreductase/nitrate reductase gamma subunit
MGNLAEATRPILWNISGTWAMYLMFVVALGVFSWGIYLRVRTWREGREDGERFRDLGKRFVLLVRELLLQKKVRGRLVPGIFHSLVFYSFAVLVVTTAVVALDADFGTSLFRGYLYVALTVASELGGVLILVGVGMAVWRRVVMRPSWLPSEGEDLWALGFLGLLIVTGFLVEGARLAVLPDRWAYLSPVGWGLGKLMAGIGPEAGVWGHRVAWWVHTVAAMGWIASIPYTKFVHALVLPANIFFSKLRPRGELSRVDLEEMMSKEDFDEETFKIGVQQVTDFTWKNRLDFDACISCGRCDEICPAAQAGHPFSPRRFVAGCRDLVARWKDEAAQADSETPPAPDVVGKAFDKEFIWYCRTCLACMEVCPACIEHVDSIMEVRRNEVLMQGRVPSEAGRALKSLENLGNPFGPQGDRVEWIQETGLRVVGPGESCDVIYWVGCCTTFDESKRAIAEDLCRLLEACGIDFGVLGKDERCCGDPARLIGDERLFQDIARRQVEALNKRKFKVLLTSCPHCYNVLKNEYRQFGGNWTVAHHSEFLHEMLWTGDLKPEIGRKRRIVYHDPCYLGRYQGVYRSPREVLRAIPGAEVLELPASQERSMCCGGGGGHFWMDLKSGKRINNLRIEQAEEAGADTIVTACAYCKQMLEDGIKQKDLDERIEVVDLATLTRSSILPCCQARRGTARDEACEN